MKGPAKVKSLEKKNIPIKFKESTLADVPKKVIETHDKIIAKKPTDDAPKVPCKEGEKNEG